MPGRVIGKEMPMGYPGSYARTPDCIIMNRIAKDEIAFGAPVVLNADNTYSAFAATNTAAQFGGVAVREVKQTTKYLDQNAVAYEAGAQCDVLERGNIIVRCGKGTPTAGGKVYIRKAANATYPDAKVGDFEAEADGNNTVELTNAYWTTGRIDADKVAELTIKYKA